VLDSIECKKGYKLNGARDRCIPTFSFFLPFPVLFLLLLVTTFFVMRKTATIPFVLALFSFGEVFIFAIQSVLAAIISHWNTFGFTLLGLVSHFVLSPYAASKIKSRIDKDNIFKHWVHPHRSKVFKSAKYLHFRAFYIFAHWQAPFESLDVTLHKPLVRYSFAHILTTYFLTMIGNVFAITSLAIGYQLTLTCIESTLVMAIQIVLLLIIQLRRRSAKKAYMAKILDISMVRGGLIDNEEGGGNEKRRRIKLLEELNSKLAKSGEKAQMLAQDGENTTKRGKVVVETMEEEEEVDYGEEGNIGFGITVSGEQVKKENSLKL